MSFEHLRTVNDVIYPSFRAAAIELGLLEDDNEWHNCLSEAAKVITNINQIRKLFVTIIINCHPSNIKKLWEEHKSSMCEDILHQERKRLNDPNLKPNENIFNLTLYLIANIFKQYDKSISDFEGFPDVDFSLLNTFDQINNYSEEENYDVDKLKEKLALNINKLNQDQLNVYQAIVAASQSEIDGPKLWFVDGPGGTGE